MNSKTPGPSHDDSLRAAEYALGVLRGPAREDLARRAAQDPALAAELRAWEEHFSQFAEEVSPVVAPPQLRTRIEQRLFQNEARAKPSLWNSLGFWRGLATASLVAVLAIGAWTLRPQNEVPATSQLVAEVAGTASQFRLVALYDTAKGELRLNRTAGTAASGRSFELWLIAGQDAPVSLGVLPAETASRIAVPDALRSKFAGSVLAISDEPEGGSPTGVATGPVVATGQLTQI